MVFILRSEIGLTAREEYPRPSSHGDVGLNQQRLRIRSWERSANSSSESPARRVRAARSAIEGRKSAASSTAMETVAVSNAGAPVELTIARSITRPATYSPCGMQPRRIHATDRSVRRETDAKLASLDMPASEFGTIQRHARGNEAGRSDCNSTALEKVVSTIGLCSNLAAGLDFNSNVIWPAVAAGLPPTSGQRDRARDRPRKPGRRSASGRTRRRRARPSSAYRTSGTAFG